MIRRFGPFCLDPVTGEVTQNGSRVHLPPQPVRILTLLTDSPGRLVTRDEIRDLIWGAVITDVDQSINFAIRQIRSALRDGAEKPQYVETIAKRGYRFIAPIEEEDKQSEIAFSSREIASAGEESRAQGPRDVAATRSRAMIVVIAAAALIAGLGAYLLHWHRLRSAPVATSSIAVLPFQNLTGDTSLDYLSDGITEETIARLATISSDRLQVIARTSAMTYKNTGKTVQQIGADLHVQYVIEGSLQRSAGQNRLIAQLIRVSDQMHLWAHSYQGTDEQLMGFEDQIAQSVADSLSISSKSRMAGHVPASAEASDAFLRGMTALAQRSRAGFESALANFGEAVRLDPQFARAYAQLAITYDLMGQYSWMGQDEANSQAKAAAQQALSLDDLSSEAHAALGFSDWFYDWDTANATKELLRAIALSPDNVDARQWYAQVLMTSGNVDQAEHEMRMAIALDPKSLISQTNLGWIEYTNRDFAAAISAIGRVVEQKPDFLNAHYKLWWVYSTVHDEPHAWQEFETIVRTISSDQQANIVSAAYQHGGYKAALVAWVRAGDWSYAGNHVDKARCYIFAGNRDGAVSSLEEGMRQHDGWMIFVPTDPAFIPLHDDPRYKAIVAKVQAGSPTG